MDAVKMLKSTQDFTFQTAGRHFFVDEILYRFNILFPFNPLLVDLGFDFFIHLGLGIKKGFALQLVLDPVNPQAGGNGCVNIKGFLGDLSLFGFLFMILQRAHIM